MAGSDHIVSNQPRTGSSHLSENNKVWTGKRANISGGGNKKSERKLKDVSRRIAKRILTISFFILNFNFDIDTVRLNFLLKFSYFAVCVRLLDSLVKGGL